MIFSYYQFAVDSEEIDRFAIRDSQGGSFLTEVARFAQGNGFASDCLSYNLYLTNPQTDAHLSRRKLLEKLERQEAHVKDEYRPMLASTIQALQSGVHYLIKKPDLQTLVGYLESSIPFLLTVNYAVLHDKQGNPVVGHDIIVTGFEQDRFWFVDPRLGREVSASAETLMFALLQRKIIGASAYLVAIYPKDKGNSLTLLD